MAPRPQQFPGRNCGLRLNSIVSDTEPDPSFDPLPASAMDTAGLGQQPARRVIPMGRRLSLSLLLSLLAHALLLSLTFSGQGFGLPGFALPWQDRRIEVPDLRVVLAPATISDPKPARTSASPPSPLVLIEQTAAARPAIVLPSTSKETIGPRPRAATAKAPAVVPRSAPKAKAGPKSKAATGKAPAVAPRSAPKVTAGSRPKAATGKTPAVVTASPPKAKAAPRSKLANGKAPAVVPRGTPKAAASPRPEVATGNAQANALADLHPQPKAPPTLIALDEPKEAEFAVPPAPREPAPVVSATSGDSGGPAQAQTDQSAREGVAENAARAESERLETLRRENERQVAARQEAARAESARLEAERRENERQAAAHQELARQEATRAESARLEAERREHAQQAAARQEATRAESARLEAERREHAQQAAARQEAARQESARAESARLEAERRENERQAAAHQELARQEATRAESARLEAERRENERQAAARQDAARQEVVREQDARRDAARRAMGRQLDEEAAQRQAAQETTRRSPSASTLRRGRLFGRTDPNAELILYADAWSRKIHFNTSVDIVREAVKQPHTDPVVTVAIRSDGSVESVTFVRSSGVAAIDDAIRRIVQSQTPGLPFQPALARDFDVIEIRRTWHFDTAIRLY